MKIWISYLFSLVLSGAMIPDILYAGEPLSKQSDIVSVKSADASLFSADEKRWLERKQALSYVYDPDWAPFEWKNNIGKHTGIIPDILNLVSKKSGIVLKPVNTDTWQESVERMKNRQADMFSAITQNTAREKYLEFTSRDIYSYPAVLITRFNDKAVYLDVDKSFKGKKIGIVKSSGLGEYIKEKYPELDYVELAATQDGFHAIRDNRIDYFAINTVTAKYFIEKKSFDDLKIALKLDYRYHLKIAIRKDLPKEIISIIDKSLASIGEKEINNIFNKWTEIYTIQHTNWKLFFQLGGILLVAIMFLAWNNRRLNLKVEARTKELADKNLELGNALNEIKTLRGIIPICSYCHSIRDDEGAWERMESYISKHSGAAFSHGICPSCVEKIRDEKN